MADEHDERAREIVMRHARYGMTPDDAIRMNVTKDIAAALREAVAGERKRCADKVRTGAYAYGTAANALPLSRDQAMTNLRASIAAAIEQKDD